MNVSVSCYFGRAKKARTPGRVKIPIFQLYVHTKFSPLLMDAASNQKSYIWGLD